MKKETSAPALARGGKWGDRKDASRGPRDSKTGPYASDRSPQRSDADSRGRPGAWQEAPRLGDAAFRAQREALEHAQLALKKLASQAHGEALTQLLGAWEKRDASQMPAVQELGSRVTTATRSAWAQALGGSLAEGKLTTARDALLRLEMAAEVPTPAEDVGARRNLQLQLLTKRNDPSPVQTWGQDAAVVLTGEFNDQTARRLQNVLKVLLKK
jgi:hypothetical protein